MTNARLAFVFPGQGSQQIGMLADASAEFPEILATFNEASDVLGYDLWDLCQTGEPADINLTERTQPLLLTASVSLYRAWCAKGGVRPARMAGHSLGEWSALVCAGVLSFPDAVRLVRERGRLMQEAVPAGEGAMAAVIGLDDSAVEKACAEAAQGEVVAAVNYNSPGQVVIAGAAAAVDRAIDLCKSAGAKRAMPLPVSAPFHTELMRPAAEKLAPQIEATAFHAPQIPVVHNVHAKPETDPEAIKALMVEQIYSPVRWTACVQAMAAEGTEQLLECGPGKVLAGLAKRIDRGLTCRNIEVPAQFHDALIATAE
ncbi:ACP S-malonyltransferase [Microbulbifer thermotolerans]|uniref:Malonyl CoA-acyl carrier protein transacylase n=2 Tax=Microbulbifer thermotolerans TaxID=252514 RepID=A0AB35HUR5_MICTH|nr:ACP S-malonyltransferase [Microbulbifer thermotolerans]MCX2779348.1 ACP S-malonyltransferase [Microbulbifer thermotolerans]MCX2782448.1 ACP S-malonyltransferase [Microbulbifer thermotolerans]MCX2795033.1 ACP S-malonyltransferase [Microbulbifer thermotolerans]MCX2800601.1 ACP S-malonyltransferase [Microbulbifer thermotolerans]MCX2805750.1 ACP S-malonyltransferase [Microbulbifer thermotolerans]